MWHVINAAIDNKAGKAIGISIDKAVHPVNLYGATRLVAEKLFVQGNAYRKASNQIQRHAIRQRNRQPR